MNKTCERLIKVDKTHVAHCFREEACIEKVHCRMLGTADIFVYRTHLVDQRTVEDRIIILGINISELIP